MTRAALLFAALLAACAQQPAASTPSGTVTPSPSATLASASAWVASATPGRTGEHTSAAVAWARVRATIPATIPVPVPRWLPEGLDAFVELSSLRADPPSYVIDYMRGGAVAMRFASGLTPSGAGSAIGTQVRNTRAVLQFPSGLDPGGRGWRSLAWTESGRAYLVESEILRGEDVLHVGWSLDRAGAAEVSYTRTEIGSCASASSPTETVRAWVLALGRHDPARILDCFASDKLAVDGTAFAPGTAELPTAMLDRIGTPVPIAGRVWVDVAWTFDREPESGWVQGRHGFLFYLVGLEDGRYRIFDGGTGAYGPPP